MKSYSFLFAVYVAFNLVSPCYSGLMGWLFGDSSQVMFDYDCARNDLPGEVNPERMDQAVSDSCVKGFGAEVCRDKFREALAQHLWDAKGEFSASDASAVICRENKDDWQNPDHSAEMYLYNINAYKGYDMNIEFVCWMIKTDSQNFDCPQGEATCTKIS